MAAMYHYKSQTRFHCYMLAYGITCRNSSMHIVAIAYHAFYNVNVVCACWHVNCPIIGNS